MERDWNDIESNEWDLPPKRPQPDEIPVAFLWNGPIVDGKMVIGEGKSE